MLWDLVEERSGKNHGNDKVEHALGARRGDPVSVGWECVVRQVGSSVWDGWTLACGSRTYGKELRSGLWFGDVVPMWCVVTATQVSHHLLLPPLPVLAVESNPKQQIYLSHSIFLQ